MRNVLIVDDNPEDAELARQRLERAGIACEVHYQPFGTIGKLRKGRFGLLVLDVNMPGLPGHVVAGLAREHDLDVRVMLYSTMDESVLRELSADCGCDGWLCKSASRSDFIAEVERLLSKEAAVPV